MPILSTQPDNINFLSPLGYKFVLKRAPNLSFFVTDCNLPSVAFGEIQVPNPFKTIDIPGDDLDYGDFNLTFRVDEDFANYREIYKWMVALGAPQSFGQYRALAQNPPGSSERIYSDGTLYIMNSAMVPNIEITFYDLFPVALSDINFTSTDTDVNYVVNTATFKYKIWDIKKL